MSSDESSYASISTEGNSPGLGPIFQPPAIPLKTTTDKTRIANLTYYYPNSNIDIFPTCLNQNECSASIILSQSNTVATSVGKSSAKSDAFSVSSNRPVPTCCAIYYYEATILCDGVDGHIAVGFGPPDAHTLLPGWGAKSIGYHADDGFVFHTAHSRYGPGYKAGDVVGCGVNLENNLFFFTQNGYHYGYYPETFLTKDPSTFYVLVGMQSLRESVSVNFGQEKFMFDLKGLFKKEQCALLKSMGDTTPVHINVICRMLVEYLVYNGYYKTAVEFGEVLAVDVEFDSSLFRFSQELKELVLSGDMLPAILKCTEKFPQIFEDNAGVYFQMRVRHFVELIMSFNRELCPIADLLFAASVEETSLSRSSAVQLMVFARELFQLCHSLFGGNKSGLAVNEKHLMQAVSLLQFENPWTSPFGKVLMTGSHRMEIFSKLNSIILESFGSQKTPSIEIARNQLIKCLELMRKMKMPESFLMPSF